MDAASPLFEAYNVGLDKSDANLVDALHTSAGDSILRGLLGVVHPIGHIDFYLNGGTYQPGCWEVGESLRPVHKLRRKRLPDFSADRFSMKNRIIFF